ncbi:MAG: lipoyl(octanoyl) transferase LipB [Thermomicrobiaceae bacterium]|nr:lipoyl(octanoyl) transferase LipB [Thermomicrobiaceae bacterium]
MEPIPPLAAAIARLARPEPGALPRLVAVRLPGLQPYLPLWEAQRALADLRREGAIDDLLLLLEHERVYTNGRHGDRANLLADEATLARLGIAYIVADRGGDITYHGPGQLVAYPVVHLGRLGLGVKAYVERLEAAVIRAAARLGVAATSSPGYTGVWVGRDKLAAIGVRVRYGVAYHGVAVNVAPDLADFDRIVPCGIPDRGVTSLAQLLGRPVAVDEVALLCAQALAELLGPRLVWASLAGADATLSPAAG